MEVTKDSIVTVTTPDKTVWAKGVLQQMQNELWIVENTGIRRSLYVYNQLPTTTALTWAVGDKGLPPPTDFDNAMKQGTPGVVFLFWKCINEANCDFSQVAEYADSLLSKMKESIASKDSFTGIVGDVRDDCQVHLTCKECIGDKSNKCGWCSKNVFYKNGTVEGKQCAGHNSDGSKEPFVCNGV
jgi:hypothetical protein